MKDGWHKIEGHLIYVEDNKVKRGMTGEGVSQRTTHPYRWIGRIGCWTNDTGVSVESFRAGVRRGTVMMK